MRPESDAPLPMASVVVTAHGWRSVQRVVVLLTGRGYVLDGLEAVPSSCPPSWLVRLDVRCSAADLRLLRTRLERLPSVTEVRTVTSPSDAPG